MTSVLEDALRLAVAALSVFVFSIGLIAYLRRPTRRMLLVVAFFAVLLAQGVLLVAEVFIIDTPVTESTYYAFQLVEIALIALILLKR